MSVRRWAVASTTSLLAIGLAAAPSTATFSGADGRITFNRVVGDKHLEIFSANADGSDVTQLTSTPPRGAVISDWSPDGQTIAFDSDRIDIDGRRKGVQIYLMNADGTGETQLTRGPGFHGLPGFSPDGSRLAIDADWGTPRQLAGIWTIPSSDPDGVTVEEAERVTTVDRERVDFDSEPQFSPDGETIVFTRFKSPRRSAIHTVNVDGSGLKRLTPYRLQASDPDWSPDGERITFDSGDAGRPGSKLDIYVMNADGTGKGRLTNNPRLTENSPFKGANNPVFSPSGTKIMYTQFLPDERNELRVMNPDGSQKKTVVDVSGFPNKADWGTHP